MMKKHAIDYKRELEDAAKSMIMIHEPQLLIKLIVRNIVRKVRIQHAGMILYEPNRDTYVLNISRGETGMRIPEGFARFDKNSPLIRLFTNPDHKSLMINKNAVLIHDINKMIWQESLLNNGNGCQELLHRVGDQMRMFNSVACIPANYKDRLLAILLLGEKIDGEPFDKYELDFFAALASDVAMAIRNAQLFEDLKRESERNHDLFLRTTVVLGRMIEARDQYTQGHTEGVTEYAIAIARQMVENKTAKFEESFYESLYVAGMMHDIGKVGVPDCILNKADRLTDEEFEVVKQHPLQGEEILKPLSELKESLDGVKYHHERFDGKGYPHGLKGEEIPIIAAIISVADAFDAMTTDRPYRRHLTKAEAVEEINKNSGTQFEPRAAHALVELFEAGKL